MSNTANVGASPAPLNRINYMDTARGIALFCVMLGHLYEEVHACDLAVKVFYTFHLPIFYLIAGYFFRYKDWKTFIKDKARAYLIPYLSFSVIMIVSDVLFQWQRRGKVFLTDFTGFLVQNRYTTLWFLASLFLGLVFFWLICRLCKQDLKKILIVSILIGCIGLCYDEFVGVPLPWNLDTAVIVQIYLGIGYAWKQRGTIEKLVGDSYKLWQKVLIALGFVAITAALSIGNYLAVHETLAMYWCQYGIFPLTIAASVFMSMAVIMLAAGLDKLTGNRAYRKPFTFLGRNSLVYFALHQSVGITVAVELNRMWHLGQNLWIMFAIELLYCIIMDLLIRCTPLRFMLGKKGARK